MRSDNCSPKQNIISTFSYSKQWPERKKSLSFSYNDTYNLLNENKIATQPGDLNLFRTAKLVIDGYNKNEVEIMTKVSKNKGFFEKFFHFFN